MVFQQPSDFRSIGTSTEWSSQPPPKSVQSQARVGSHEVVCKDQRWFLRSRTLALAGLLFQEYMSLPLTINIKALCKMQSIHKGDFFFKNQYTFVKNAKPDWGNKQKQWHTLCIPSVSSHSTAPCCWDGHVSAVATTLEAHVTSATFRASVRELAHVLLVMINPNGQESQML